MAQNWTNYPISHGYSTQYQGPGTDTPHYADDVATPFHTPISALWAGKVVQSDAAVWSGQPGGIELFIKPDDPGIPEYYFYHLDHADVGAGQHVNAGQEVGLSGGQNSGGEHPTSSMWSTGPHTHVGFFSSYVQTPAGSRPYGPDISSYLKSGVSNVSPLSSSVNASATIPGTNITLPNINWPDFGYRVALAAIGVGMIYLGVKRFVSSPTVVVEGK